MPPKNDIWDAYTRDITPLNRRKKKTAKVMRAKENQTALKANATARKTVMTQATAGAAGDPYASPLERLREKALRKGSVTPEAKLDLHGMTQTEAFEKLARFLERTVKAKKRNLLIVTGKGPKGEGVLRRNLKSWLTQLPEAQNILTLRQAAPKHGGEGAFYVLLRKR